MSCPICHIGGSSYTSKQQNRRSNTGPKGPSRFSTYPPYAGPQDTLTFANERPLDYPYIHAKIYNRTPSAAYLQLKAEAEKERASEERRQRRHQVACGGGSNSIREALCHLQTAERLLTH